MNISVIGSGYVGLTTGTGFAKLGNKVTFIDIDKEKINKINNGITPIYEEGLEELLKENSDRITATNNYKEAIENTDVSFVCVGTPSNKDGSIDLSYVEEAIKEIGKVLKNKENRHIVVIKSTVIPGTTKNHILPLLEKTSGKKVGQDIGLAMNPEFLREGVGVKDFFEPDRIVLGYHDKKTLDVLKELYKIFSCPIVETSLSSAEMIKYASNAFLATKISFINEIGNMCKKLDIDTYEVADGMGLDKRIGRAFLNSGIGWGGSCFPKDVKALVNWAEKNNVDSYINNSTIKVNDLQPLKLIELLKKHVPKLNGKTIGVLGLAFKPNTDDIRESRALIIVEKLLKENAKIKAYDPLAADNFKKIYPDISYVSKAEDVLESDAILIVTEWDEFKKLDYSNKIVIDGRKIEKAKEQAKIYEGVCW